MVSVSSMISFHSSLPHTVTSNKTAGKLKNCNNLLIKPAGSAPPEALIQHIMLIYSVSLLLSSWVLLFGLVTCCPHKSRLFSPLSNFIKGHDSTIWDIRRGKIIINNDKNCHQSVSELRAARYVGCWCQSVCLSRLIRGHADVN